MLSLPARCPLERLLLHVFQQWVSGDLERQRTVIKISMLMALIGAIAAMSHLNVERKVPEQET